MADIVIVDDHVLLRNGLAGLLKNQGHNVLFEADNGQDFIQKLGNLEKKPALVLMDINMPEMDGYETCRWLKSNHPKVKVLALSMYDNEAAIIRMLKNGAKGYLLKDSEPSELTNAIENILNKGFHYSELVSGKLINAIHKIDDGSETESGMVKLNDREIEFLKHACSEMSYKEIADIMCVSPRTVDGYRDHLFIKLQIKTRVGLVLYAIKHKIVDVNT